MGISKGRKKIKEADIDCAVREFCEETQLYKDDISIDRNVIPFQEIFLELIMYCINMYTILQK